jgi:hypothetical protein
MEQANQQSLSYRVAIRLFDSAFAACERLPDAERQSLMREISAQLLQRMPKSPIPTEAPQPVKITGISVKVEEQTAAVQVRPTPDA